MDYLVLEQLWNKYFAERSCHKSEYLLYKFNLSIYFNDNRVWSNIYLDTKMKMSIFQKLMISQQQEHKSEKGAKFGTSDMRCDRRHR